MNIGSINGPSSSYLQSVLTSALQDAGLTANKISNQTSGIDTSPVALRSDNSQVSPLAQLMSTLQQLQQSDPAKYQQVTQQIATNLQNAAQAAQSDGNTTAATQLNQLAQDFTDASKSGQLPSIKDLAKALGGHHHHHHVQAASADSDADAGSASGSASSSNSASQTLSQILAAFQANGAQSDALNPMSIIMNTLSKAAT